MRRSLLAPLLLALALAAPAASAQPPAFAPRTGDDWIDASLADINRYGDTYRDPFVDELVRYHAAPRELVLELLARPGWTPGDAYFACSLAAAVGRPCRYVVDEYERERAAGWGALAQRLGIAPGSPAFHRLKRGVVATYDRWGRPIRIDADLERDFPQRARPRPDRGPPAEADGRRPGDAPSRGARDTGKPKEDAPKRGRGGGEKDTGKRGKGGPGR